MSEEESKLDEGRRLLDEAIEACDRLNRLDKDVLSEIAKHRIRWPITIMGSKGRISSGKKAEEYIEDLGVGSSVPVKADPPKGGLKAFVLEYVDWVYSLRGLKELTKPEIVIPDEYIEHGLEGEYCERAEWDWIRKENAFRLPELSRETTKEWADHISEVIVNEAYEFGDKEVIEFLGKEQLATIGGFPIEIEKKIVSNYKKLLKRNLETAKQRAEDANKRSRLKGMGEDWKTFFITEAKQKTTLVKYEASSAREVVGDILNSIIIASPQK